MTSASSNGVTWSAQVNSEVGAGDLAVATTPSEAAALAPSAAAGEKSRVAALTVMECAEGHPRGHRRRPWQCDFRPGRL